MANFPGLGRNTALRLGFVPKYLETLDRGGAGIDNFLGTAGTAGLGAAGAPWLGRFPYHAPRLEAMPGLS